MGCWSDAVSCEITWLPNLHGLGGDEGCRGEDDEGSDAAHDWEWRG